MQHATLQRPATRPRPADLLLGVGVGCIVLGGLVAAVTGPLQLAHGSWLAAYLVLVCGLAQYTIGRAPALLGTHPMSPGRGWAEVACWNLGNAAVIAGTLVATPALVDLGAVALVAGLALAWRSSRPVAAAARTLPRRAAAHGYRLLLLALLISIPVGAALAHLRH